MYGSKKNTNREKNYDVRDHDATVLDLVRQHRSGSKSLLDAGILFLTCDYSLYHFDWNQSRSNNIRPCTVTPDILWQVLRPYIPYDVTFEKAFAETFAIPEFRTIRSERVAATSKLANLLARHKDLQPEISMKMLSNMVFIGEVARIKDPQEVQEFINIEIIKQINQLSEENAASARSKERVEADNKEKQQKIELFEELAVKNSQEINNLQHQLQIEKDTNLKNTEEIQKEQYLAGRRVEVANELAKQDRLDAQKFLLSVEEERAARLQLEKTFNLFVKGSITVLISLFLIAGIEIAINFIPIFWIIQNDNSYGIQIGLGFLIVSLVIGLVYSKTRAYSWGVAALSFAGIIIQLL